MGRESGRYRPKAYPATTPSLLEASYNLAMAGSQSQSLSGSLALCSLCVLSAQLQCQLIATATATGTTPPVAPALHL